MPVKPTPPGGRSSREHDTSCRSARLAATVLRPPPESRFTQGGGFLGAQSALSHQNIIRKTDKLLVRAGDGLVLHPAIKYLEFIGNIFANPQTGG